MLSLPGIDYGKEMSPTHANEISISEDEVPGTQILMQIFASSTIRYLSNRGSNIKRFVVAPYLVYHKLRPTADANENVWPRYFYSRGRISNVIGTEVLNAIPSSVRGDYMEPGYNVLRPRSL
jgi:hypothetical protein